MLEALQKKTVAVRILLGIFVALIAAGMLVYLVPGGGGTGTITADTVADVGGQQVSVSDVQQQMQRIQARGAQIPRALQGLYAQQVLNQLIYERMLELEAKRLGMRVTDQERAERIRLLVPTAFEGTSFVGMDRYAAQVQMMYQVSVPEFEELIRQGLLEEKFRRLVTDGIAVTPEEVDQEFRRRNEKIKIAYVIVKPDELESKVNVTDADLTAYFDKNKGRYIVPERRVVRYAMLDVSQLQQRANITDDELRAYYNEHIERYRLENRVRVSHILFKTVGKTDAEVAEIRKKAEEVLQKARKGTKFEDLAKQYSEDAAKDKGGDLGWIVQGQQMSPELQHVVFSLPKGGVSEVIRTPYSLEIIKVVDHESARTQSFEEVRGSIWPTVSQQKVERVASEEADKIAAVVRRSTRVSLDDLAKQFNLTVGETKPIAPTDPVAELGNGSGLRDTIFQLRQGEVSSPIRTDRGFVLLSVKELQPTHPGTLAELRDKVTAQYRREKAVELAKTRAEELAKRAQSGEGLDAAAKALGFEVKNSELLARVGSVPDIGSARQFGDAFNLTAGAIGGPTFLGANWLVYRVVERQEVKPEELAKQRKEIEQQVLQAKRDVAYQAFRNALEDHLRREGKLTLRPEAMKRLTGGA